MENKQVVKEENKTIIIVMEGGVIHNIVGNTENVTVKVLDHDKIEDLESIIKFGNRDDLEDWEIRELEEAPKELEEQKQLIEDCDSLEDIDY